MPALLTRMSTWPCCSSTSATTRWQSATSADVALVHRHAVGRGRRQLAGRVVVARVPGRDRCALVEQVLADRTADAPGSTGDECYLTVQAVAHGAPFVGGSVGGARSSGERGEQRRPVVAQRRPAHEQPEVAGVDQLAPDLVRRRAHQARPARAPAPAA